MLLCIVVYIWVDRIRRNAGYLEVSFNLCFPFEHIEKYPQCPLIKPRFIKLLRGIVVYFWVDRLRRKAGYWEESINLCFPFVLLLS
jgi:uncharacterized membrane protein (DUF106 family)